MLKRKMCLDFGQVEHVTWYYIAAVVVAATIRDVNETRETRDSKKFLGIEIYISRLREFETVH